MQLQRINPHCIWGFWKNLLFEAVYCTAQECLGQKAYIDVHRQQEEEEEFYRL